MNAPHAPALPLRVGDVVTSPGLDRGPNWRWRVVDVRSNGMVIIQGERLKNGWIPTRERMPAMPRDVEVVR